MASGESYKAQQFIDAIKDSGGIVSVISRRVGCDWHTARRYIDSYATVKQAYDDECERIIDLAESKVIESINSGDGKMIRYYLSTKGRKRGYVSRQETALSNEDGKAFLIQYVIPDENKTNSDAG